MPPAQPIDPYKSLFAFFAYELRRHREARALSQDQLAKELYVTRAAIESYENQRNQPKNEFAVQLDDYFATGHHFQALLYYAKQEHLLHWLEKYAEYVELEGEASEIRAFQVLNIPGLLQTADYARALFRVGQQTQTKESIEEAVEGRLARQSVLTRSDPPPPQLWVLLDQVVIERPIGGPEVMKAQLRHLIEMSYLPHVSIRVVPRVTGEYEGLDGSVLLLSVGGERVGYSEVVLAGRLTYETADITEIALRYDRIGARALHVEGSRRLIREVMEGMK